MVWNKSVVIWKFSYNLSLYHGIIGIVKLEYSTSDFSLNKTQKNPEHMSKTIPLVPLNHHYYVTYTPTFSQCLKVDVVRVTKKKSLEMYFHTGLVMNTLTTGVNGGKHKIFPHSPAFRPKINTL